MAITSLTPDITERIPTPLSRAMEASQTFTNNGVRFDTAIAGVAFFQAASDQRPYVRQTAPIQKDQIDTSKEAGEQSLNGDWIRSQTSWHHGAGVRFYEPGSDPATQYRFEDSLGVDVFTKDQVTLLKRCRIGGYEDFTYTAGTLLRTNLCTNPSFETNTTGWSGLNGATVAQSSTRAWVGTKSCLITHAAGAGVTSVASITVSGLTIGQSYTVSAYIYVPAATTTNAEIWASGIGAGTVVSVKDAWDRSYKTITATATAHTFFIATTGNTTAGQQMWFDGVLVEQTSTLGAYFDGDTTDSSTYVYGWGGTAHGSTSTQSAAVYTPNNPATVTAGQYAFAVGAIVGGADVFFTNEAGTIKRRSGATGAVLASYTGATSQAAAPPTIAGGQILASDGFGIRTASPTGSSFSTLYSQGLGAVPYPYWVKSRLIVTRLNRIWELAPDGSTSAGNLDTATPLYSHLDTNWTWSAVAESPSAILAAGYSNGYSAVYRFTLEDAGAGATPTLGSAFQVTEMPLGEEILSLKVYLGRYIGIGTTRGLRIGIVSDQGEVQYGPLIVEAGPVRALASSDRFIYGAVTAAHPDGKGGALCVDLEEEIVEGSLRFPYAWHARAGTSGQVDSVAVIGASGRVALGVLGEGVYTQSATEYEPSGWVRSGRVRYATVEQKAFRTADVGSAVADGAVSLFAVQDDGDEVFVRRMDESSADGTNISLGRVAGTYEYLQFKLLLTPGAQSPTLDSLQIRALPAPRRRRLIQYPLLCMDFEQAPGGVKVGKQGWARDRLLALEEAESTKAVVLVQDFRMGESFDAVVEQIEFRMPGPPSTDGRKNVGGFIMATVRRLG